jgi:hypothetical protein
VRKEGRVKRRLTARGHLADATEVHVGRREQGEPLVVMIVVVP